MLPTHFPGRFGPFELEGLLGRGGMARVYDGHRLGAHGVRTRVAIKCLLADDGTDPRVIQMFIDEARLNAQLRHPNLIAIHDFNEVDGVPYIAMEFVDGCDLSELIDELSAQGERLPLPIVAEILRQLLAGLDYAHSAIGQDGSPLGLIHRDLKPANIFISHQGVVKIGDFGIAKTRFSSLKTSTGMLKGTPAYLSPEQFKGQEITPAVDFFALGLILFEMLSGSRFFQQTTLAALAGAMLTFRPSEAIASLDAQANALFLPILEGLLAPTPSQRFNQAADVLTALGPVFAAYPLLTPLRTWVAPYTQEIKGQRALTTLRDIDLGTLVSQNTAPPLGAIPGEFSDKTANFDTGSIPGTVPDATANFGMESMARLMMDPSLTPEAQPLNTPTNGPISEVGPSTLGTNPDPPLAGHAPSPTMLPTRGKNWPALALGALLVLVLGTLGLKQMANTETSVTSIAPPPSSDTIEASSDLKPEGGILQPQPPPPEAEPQSGPQNSTTATAKTTALKEAPPAKSVAPPALKAPSSAKTEPAPQAPKPAAVASVKAQSVEVALGAIPSDSRVSIDGGSAKAVPWKGSLTAGPHTATFHCEGYKKTVPFTLEAGQPHRLVWHCPSERPYQPPGR